MMDISMSTHRILDYTEMQKFMSKTLSYLPIIPYGPIQIVKSIAQ